MPRRKLTTESLINNLSVNAYTGYPVFVSATENYQQQLRYMYSKYGKVLVLQCLAHFPTYMKADSSNATIVNTMKKFHLMTRRAGVEILTFWGREQKDSPNQHYHIGLICDGTRITNPDEVFNWLNGIWSREIGVAVESNMIHRSSCNPLNLSLDTSSLSRGIRIDKSSETVQNQLNDASNWLSYITKTRQKGKAPEGVREFGFSQIPKKN